MTTTMADLAKRKCVPCEGGTPRLGRAKIESLLGRLRGGWKPAERGRRLTKRFVFPDFASALAFIARMGEVAEAEQHHPDFCLHDYKLVDVVLTTHAIDGLSENDFILAAKIDRATDKVTGAGRAPATV
jgi:4a-hydroxytetrahydrobiopterin dehydratase